MKAVFIIFLSFLFAVNAKSQDCGNSYSSIVFEEKSGDILFEKRPENIIYPASLVKLMTLYLTFEAIENHKITPDKKIIFSDYAQEISEVNKANSLHIKAGDKITVRVAIQAAIVKSFNEASVALAEAVSGSEWEFVRKMNKKAAKLGMINTNFKNASGLHDEGQYTTSYDLARLAAAIKKDFPGYYHLFSLKKFTYAGEKYKTHNHVLVDYKGAEGLKTGFTNASGFNLITAAKKNNIRIISVLAGCPTRQVRDEFMKELLNNSFDRLKKSKKNIIEVKLAKHLKE